ncbi:MAG: class I SAM-dependent methyltransferase [Phycisphaerales bacterium]
MRDVRDTLDPVPSDAWSRFESAYAEAEATNDLSKVPWEDGRPNPALVAWLDHAAPAVVRCGARVAVVGCGLGHDARELMRRGYDVTAFDVSPSAVRWAKRIDPENANCYFRANVLEPPPRWLHRFDLVVEVYTIQSLPPETRPAMMEAIARLVGMNGSMLVVCRAADEPVRRDDGPPWALTSAELLELATGAGLQSDGIESFVDDERPPRRRLRGLFHRV